MKKRIVIKVGTNVLMDENDRLDHQVFDQIVAQIAAIREMGWSPILVSSGAVGAGRAILKEYRGNDETIIKQVLSSIGQMHLMKIYSDLFAKHQIICSQVLATKEDFNSIEHHRNMYNCFEGLLSEDIVPIVNENDVVSLIELMFSDNDELAGLTARMIKADKLVILTNVEGFYNGNPSDNDTEVLHEIDVSDPKVKKYIQKETSSQGKGGMQSKFDAAAYAASKGIETYIAGGKKPNVIINIVNNEEEGSRFSF